LTNVPFSKFGEGSFDKGIRIVIPLEWALPIGSTTTYEMDLRPIQRDGGQPLENDAILYDMTQSSNEGDLQRQWSDVLQ
jgi:Exopolysaccharide biosynthesis protein YbjH